MNRKLVMIGIIFAVIAFAAGWTTNKASGTKHAFAIVAADDSAVIGVGAPIPWGGSGPTFLSIQSIAAAIGAVDSLEIYSGDLLNSNGIDTMYVAVAAAGYNGNFGRGIDSLHVLDVTSSKLIFEASN